MHWHYKARRPLTIIGIGRLNEGEYLTPETVKALAGMRPSLDEYVRLNLIIRTPESPTGEMPKVEAPAKAKPGTKRVKVS